MEEVAIRKKQTEENVDATDELLRKRKAKEAALMRYINEGEYKKDYEADGEKTFKGLLQSFFYTLYVVFVHPILSDRALKQKLLTKAIMVIIVILVAHWLSPIFNYENENLKTDASLIADDNK